MPSKTFDTRYRQNVHLEASENGSASREEDAIFSLG